MVPGLSAAKAAAARADDTVIPFQVEGMPVRGRLVRLGAVADTIIGRHDYPPAISRVLGETLVLTAMLGAALKFDGVFILQTQSKGPMTLMVTDYDTAGRLRGYARFEPEAVARISRGDDREPAFNRLVGAGHMAFTVDQGPDSERYQGIVGLEGASVADCAHAYFRQSEQLQTAIKLAAGRDAGGRWRAGGIMVQRLPGEPDALDSDAGEDAGEDNWRRAVALMSSARDEELTDPGLTPEGLLWRLFHEDGVRVFEGPSLDAGCRCGRGRVEEVLRSFAVDDLADMADDGRITVTCEFCNTAYVFAVSELDLAAG